MTPKDISESKNPDLRASLNALWRAGELARKIAIQTGTDLIIVRDGQIVRISPEELIEQARLKDAQGS